jgi:hypothetical protein
MWWNGIVIDMNGGWGERSYTIDLSGDKVCAVFEFQIRDMYHSYTGQLVVDQIGGLMSHLFGNHL